MENIKQHLVYAVWVYISCAAGNARARDKPNDAYGLI